MTMVPKSLAPKCWSIARAAAALGLACGLLALTNPPRALAANDRFRATIPDGGAGEDLLRTPLQFEQAATGHPQSAAQSLFSRCRRPPFNATVSLYSPITAPGIDAIVNDTAFGFADGSSCYNPQYEQNIVINPANAQNVVTSSNEYRVNLHAVYYSRDGGQHWGHEVVP